MQDVLITKLEAAEANLRASLRLYFEGEHYAPVHTLAAAANEVIEKLSERSGVSTHLLPASLIEKAPPNVKRLLFNVLRNTQNFCKHANDETEEEHVLVPFKTNFILYESSRHLVALKQAKQSKLCVENCFLPLFYIMYFHLVVYPGDSKEQLAGVANHLLGLLSVTVACLPKTDARVDWGTWYKTNVPIIEGWLVGWVAAPRFEESVKKFIEKLDIMPLLDEMLEQEAAFVTKS